MSGFTAEIDQITPQAWDAALLSFRDAVIYQTSAYGRARWGEHRLSRLVLKQGETTVALAQVSLARVPLLGAGIAYVPWGPVWKLNGQAEDPEIFRAAIRALRDEFAVRRGLLLRIRPHVFAGGPTDFTALLEAEGFRLTSQSYRTLLIDLVQPLENLRQGLSKRWKRALRAAQERGLTVRAGTGQDLYDVFKRLYGEMVERKGFVPGVNIDEFEQVQSNLPETMKMHIILCEDKGEPVAALIASKLGELGIGLIGATGNKGMDTGSFHRLNWEMIEWLKASGARGYDFGGYNPAENPGTAGFKDGLPGLDVSHVGLFEICFRPLSAIPVRAGTAILKALRRGRQKLRSFHHRRKTK